MTIDRRSFDAGRDDLADELAAALDEHRNANGTVDPTTAAAILIETLSDMGAIEVCKFCDHPTARIADECPHCGNPTWHDLTTCPCDECDAVRRDENLIRFPGSRRF